MKRFLLPVLFAFVIPVSFSCSGLKNGYILNERDAASAIRQLLEIGTRDGALNGNAFSKETIMTAVFPEPVRKVLNTVQQLGLTNEVNRFTATLSTAAEKTATNATPIFLGAINNLKFNDAMRIIKNGGTSATDFLRSSVGDSLRRSITPVMQAAINEYKLNEQWDDITKPVKGISGNRLNIDLANLMAGVVSEAMFQKIEAKEREVRANAAARTTPLLQKVFSRNWN